MRAARGRPREMVRPLWKAARPRLPARNILSPHHPAFTHLDIPPDESKKKKNLRPHACAHGCLHHLYSQLPRLRSNGDGEAFGKRTAKGAAASRWDSWPRGHELPSHETTRRKLKSTLLSRRRQSEKATRCAVPPLGQPRKSKIVRTAGRSTFPGIAGGREGCLAEAQRIVRAVTTLCMLRG